MKHRLLLALGLGAALLAVAGGSLAIPSSSKALCRDPLPNGQCPPPPLTELPTPVKWQSLTESQDNASADDDSKYLGFVDPDSPASTPPPGDNPDPNDNARNGYFVVPPGGDPDAAQIYNITPAYGCHGAILKVDGANFTGKGNEGPVNTVEFNGSAAAFSIQSASVLYVAIPTGAIDGRIRTHQLFKPDGVSDVIVYSVQSVDVLECQTNGGGDTPQNADPSLKISIGASGLTSSDTLLTSAGAQLSASMPMSSIDWQYDLGRAKGGNFTSIYNLIGGTVINTGKFFDIPSVSAPVIKFPCCVIQPPKLLQQGEVKVKAKFPVGGVTRVINKKVRVQRNIDLTGGKKVADTPYYEIYIVPPYFQSSSSVLHSGGDRVTTEAIFEMKKGSVVSGNWLVQLDNGLPRMSEGFIFKPGQKTVVTWLNAKTQNEFQGTWAWNTKVMQGTVSIKDSETGDIHTFNLATGFTTSIVKAAWKAAGSGDSAGF